jgi:signal transduction histidine kinase
LEKPTDETCRVILFRSIRELLINAAKHSGVLEVRLGLRREGEQLVVTVEDRGAGMDARLPDTKGTGLVSIRERLAHVGGTLRIESETGRGTRIRLSAPIGCGEAIEPGEPS